MLKWPLKAIGAIQKLFEPLQDIDVYVEDTNDEVFYRSLIKNATRDSVNIARVFGLGGRPHVIEAARKHNQKARRALFIIDGDLEWVKGESSPNIIGLHCHEAYCVENLLLCEQALSFLLSQEKNIPEDKAKIRLAYGQWVQTIQSHLLELFAAFATLHTVEPTVATVSQKVGNLCSRQKKLVRLDAVKVSNAKENALKAAEKIIDQKTISVRFAETLDRLGNLPNPLHAISGKDFLLPLVDFHLQSLGCRIERKALRNRLAGSGNPARFSSLANALLRAAQGNF